MNVKAIAACSKELVPAFTRIRGTGAAQRSIELDLLVSPEGHPRASEGESILGRWVVETLLGWALLTPEGGMPGDGDELASVVPLFRGATSAVVTDRRIIGVTWSGDCVLGPLTERDHTMAIWSYRHSDMGTVAVDLEARRLRGGFKETGLSVMGNRQALGGLRTSGRLLPVDKDFKSTQQLASPGEVAAVLLRAGCGYRMATEPDLAPDERARLERVATGMEMAHRGDSRVAVINGPAL